VTENRSVDPEFARLRAKAREQELEIARLRDEAADASGTLAELGVEAQEHDRHERNLSALIERLRTEARFKLTWLSGCSSGWPRTSANSKTCARCVMP
jgi:hypothetical protein